MCCCWMCWVDGHFNTLQNNDNTVQGWVCKSDVTFWFASCHVTTAWHVFIYWKHTIRIFSHGINTTPLANVYKHALCMVDDVDFETEDNTTKLSLRKEDIIWADLNERKPEELTITQFKWWLLCWIAPLQGGKNRLSR